MSFDRYVGKTSASTYERYCRIALCASTRGWLLNAHRNASPHFQPYHLDSIVLRRTPAPLPHAYPVLKITLARGRVPSSFCVPSRKANCPS